MTSCAWLWLYFGAFLMVMELLAAGFVVFVFGLSAATVGLCRFAMGESFTLTWQLAAFSAFSILYLVVLRRWLKRLFTGGRVETKKAVYVFEFKFNKSAKAAVRQVREKGYADAYKGGKRPVTLVGINFSARKRNIDEPLIERL